MRARSYLFTLYMEYLYPENRAWVGDLIRWMELLGFSEPAVRAAVSRSVAICSRAQRQSARCCSTYARTAPCSAKAARTLAQPRSLPRLRLSRPRPAPRSRAFAVLIWALWSRTK